MIDIPLFVDFSGFHRFFPLKVGFGDCKKLTPISLTVFVVGFKVTVGFAILEVLIGYQMTKRIVEFI